MLHARLSFLAEAPQAIHMFYTQPLYLPNFQHNSDCKPTIPDHVAADILQVSRIALLKPRFWRILASWGLVTWTGCAIRLPSALAERGRPILIIVHYRSSTISTHLDSEHCSPRSPCKATSRVLHIHCNSSDNRRKMTSPVQLSQRLRAIKLYKEVNRGLGISLALYRDRWYFVPLSLYELP